MMRKRSDKASFIFWRKNMKIDFKKIPVKAFYKKLIKFTVIHTPEILTAAGITGMISSTVFAVEATPKAMEALREYENDIPFRTKVRVCWKYYVPSAGMMLLSAGCLIGSNSISIRRNAALATAYKLSADALAEYQEKVIETIGEKKEKTIREEIAKEKIKESPYSEERLFETKKGDSICLDSYSGRYFKTNIESVKQAINKLNYSLIQHQFVSLNDFYYELGLPPIKLGEDLGWPVEKGLINVDFGSDLVDGETPCLVLNYTPPIKYEYLYL